LTLGTHVAFASVLYLGDATLFGYQPDTVGWLLVAVASLLPDIDLPPAKISWPGRVSLRGAAYRTDRPGGKVPHLAVQGSPLRRDCRRL